MKERRNSRFAFVKNTVKDFPKVTRAQFLRRNTRFSSFRVTSLRAIQNIFTPISSLFEVLVVRMNDELEKKTREFMIFHPNWFRFPIKMGRRWGSNGNKMKLQQFL